MSKIALSGDASGTGTFTIASPNSNSNFTLTIPQATTTIVGTDATQTLTNKTLGSGLVMGASTITSATAQASTSGTSIDFTGIPSWVKRVTVMFYRISTNGTSPIQVQLGDSGGIETTDYEVTSVYINTGADNGVYTAGFPFRQVSGGAAGGTQSGQIVFNLIDASTNKWSGSGSLGWTSAPIMINAGSKSLSATLDRVRITTVNGTDTFDAGSINILYE